MFVRHFDIESEAGDNERRRRRRETKVESSGNRSIGAYHLINACSSCVPAWPSQRLSLSWLNFSLSLSIDSLFQISNLISLSLLFSRIRHCATVFSRKHCCGLYFCGESVMFVSNALYFCGNQFDRINATKHSQRDLSVRVDEVLHRINPVLPKVCPFWFHFNVRLKPSTFFFSYLKITYSPKN